jgi:tripartite-type tricarboxylate transporter receptor subunit TctC
MKRRCSTWLTASLSRSRNADHAAPLFHSQHLAGFDRRTGDIMNPSRRLALSRLSALTLTMLAGTRAHGADPWPSRSIRMVVPFGAGAGPDVYARLYAAELSRALKVNVWVDNRAGASGTLGTDIVAKSPPDGYTVLFGFNQLVTFNPHLFKKLPFDVNTDLAPVSQTLKGSYVIVADPKLNESTLAHILERAKRAPRTINYASYGPGTASHLGMVLIEDKAGVELVHIPYKQAALVDVMSGLVPLVIEPVQVAVPLVKTGKVKAIAVTSAKRLDQLPDVPTVAETLPGYELAGWHGLFVAGKTPPEIITQLSSEVRRITQLPEVTQRMAADAATPTGTTPAELRDLIAREQEMWGRIIRAKNILLD